MSKPVADGVYANQRLNFAANWEGSSTECQGLKPDLRNSAVRHYRGASGNVAMVEMRSHLAIERARLVTLHLQQRASELYPNTGSELKRAQYC